MAEQKEQPWYEPFKTDDETDNDWDFFPPRKQPALDLEAIHQKSVAEAWQDEKIRADEARAHPTTGSDIVRDATRMTRALAGHVALVEEGYEDLPELDLKDTIDTLGWFTFDSSGLKEDRAQENAAKDRTGAFLTDTLEALLDLEYQAGTESGVTKEQLYPLHELTDEMQELLYVPPEERNKQNGKRKSQSRFELDSLIKLYSPKNPATNGKEIAPAKKYNFETPAQVMYSVLDRKTNRELVFEFFPQQHAHYARKPELAGSDTSDAREIMSLRDRNVERVHQQVEKAQEGLVKPYFKLKLLNYDDSKEQPERTLISEVGGEWTTKRLAGADGIRTMFGFTFRPAGIDGLDTFIPVTQAQGGEGDNIRALHRVVRGFSGLNFNYRAASQPKY